MSLRKNSKVTGFILEMLEKGVDSGVRIQDFIVNTELYAKGYDRPLKKSNLAQTLRRLRLKGFIDAKRSQNQILYRLTALGKRDLKIQKALKGESKGAWTVVVFDIPESHRKVRNVLKGGLSFGNLNFCRKVFG